MSIDEAELEIAARSSSSSGGGLRRHDGYCSRSTNSSPAVVRRQHDRRMSGSNLSDLYREEEQVRKVCNKFFYDSHGPHTRCTRAYHQPISTALFVRIATHYVIHSCLCS